MKYLTKTRIGTAAATVVLLIATMSVVPSASVQAQDSAFASFDLVVSELDDDLGIRTLAVAFTEGTTAVAALGGELRFDPTAVTVAGCELAEAGACNVTDDGTVRVSVFNLQGINDAPQLMTVDFTPTGGPATATAFDWTVTTAAGFNGAPVAVITETSLSVDLGSGQDSPAAVGSLTGDVVDAASQVGLFGLDVCLVAQLTQATTCTTTTGLGTWRLDDLAADQYTVEVSDSSGRYASASTSGQVRAGEVVAGVDVALLTVADAAELQDDGTDVASDPAAEVAEVGLEPSVSPRYWPSATPLGIDYRASIQGRISAIDTDVAIEAIQVCATQPLVLHQSCATTDAAGEFTLDGISAGNYWLATIDPLGRFEAATPKLVGVVGDDVVRSGVRLQLHAADS